MPNIVFKLGSLDLSSCVRVNPSEKLNMGQGDMIEPAWSDSPLYEGQTLTSIHVKNKELTVPLFLHPPTPPYTQDALNQLAQQVNQALRPVNDLGLTVYAQWNNAQASNSTFWTIQFGRFEPDFNFRISEKGWLAGILHLWVLPYAHTATERVVSTYAASTAQSFVSIPAASLLAAATLGLPPSSATGYAIVGDITPQFDIRMQSGSYLPDDGRVGIMAALPIPSYQVVFTPSQFNRSINNPQRFPGLTAASGAAGSAILAMDAWITQASQVIPPGQGNIAISLAPGSVYIGDNRIIGLARARSNPFCLRAFDPIGNPLGPTAIASSLDGWQLVDYGTLRVPAWATNVQVTIRSYPGPAYNASGMFAPMRAAPAIATNPYTWTQELGPIFVIPNNSSILSLDFNSPCIGMDGFDGAAGAALGQDQLGQSWIVQAGGSFAYTGNSAIAGFGWVSAGGSPVDAQSGFEAELIVTVGGSYSSGSNSVAVGLYAPSATLSGVAAQLTMGAAPYLAIYDVVSFYQPNFTTPASQMASYVASLGLTALPGQYHLRLRQTPSAVTAFLGGPSGAFVGAASGAVTSLGVVGQRLAPSSLSPALAITNFGAGASLTAEAFRARLIPSTGLAPGDMIHLQQPLGQNSRMNGGVDTVDLQARQRGALQAIQLPVPSLGAGLFFAMMPFDQGPANDVLNVDVRVRERFIYAR